MAGAIVSFSLLAVGVRELSTQMTIIQILFLRGLIGLGIVGVIITFLGWRQVATPIPGQHFFRNMIHFGGQYSWFYGLSLIPLVEVFAIEFTTPLWTALLATLFLGERMTVSRLVAIALGVVGVLIILRPGLEVVQPAAMVVLLGAALYGGAHTFTKKLSRTDTSWCIVFYMVLMQLPISIALVFLEGKFSFEFNWFWMTLVSVTALSAHYCMSRALRLADASVVVTIDFLRLPLIALVGFLLYNEKIEWAVMTGAAIMFIGIYLNIKSEVGKHDPTTD